jgi:hypothetical protein
MKLENKILSIVKKLIQIRAKNQKQKQIFAFEKYQSVMEPKPLFVNVGQIGLLLEWQQGFYTRNEIHNAIHKLIESNQLSLDLSKKHTLRMIEYDGKFVPRYDNETRLSLPSTITEQA